MRARSSKVWLGAKYPMDDTINDTPARLPNGQFPKGVSGRKFSRKSKIETVEDLYDAHSLMVAETLIKIIRDPNTASGPRVQAIKEFGDRWLGRPTQTTVTKRADNEGDDIDLSGLSEEALREIATLQARKDQ